MSDVLIEPPPVEKSGKNIPALDPFEQPYYLGLPHPARRRYLVIPYFDAAFGPEPPFPVSPQDAIEVFSSTVYGQKPTRSAGCYACYIKQDLIDILDRGRRLNNPADIRQCEREMYEAVLSHRFTRRQPASCRVSRRYRVRHASGGH